MRVTLIQQDIVWGNPLANQQSAEAAIDAAINAAEPADLYILPEMWSTGFATNPKDIAESDEGSLAWMRAQARQRGVAIAGSVATECDGRYYNRLYFVKPDGETVYYDKHHLFTYGGEHLNYTAGDQRVVVEYMGVRFLLMVCYDLRFPVWSRSRGDYDCIIYVASWPTSRMAVWNTLLRARAIENQCYVLGVNRVGTDPMCQYCGGTQVIDAYGKVVAECPEGQTSSVTVALDTDRLNAFRQKFPVLEDRDSIY